MRVKFWGVRGSIPTPLTHNQLQGKIAAVIQRITPNDLESPETREAFLAGLPNYLLGTIGGNTTCFEVRLSDDTMIIIDAGSGIRELGQTMVKQRDHIRHYHLFFTHFHWDHLQGLPFFSPQVYDPRCTITFYSPVKGFRTFLEEQMRYPFFPITMKEMNAKMEFREITGDRLQIGDARVVWRKMKHPGGCYSYKIMEGEHQVIFSTDTELTEDDFLRSEANRAFYEKVDFLVMDSQYTLNEAIEKYDWGHSSYSLAVDFAAAWEIGKLALFHHEPAYDDRKIHYIHKSAKWYLDHQEKNEVDVILATEGLELVF